MRPFSKSLRFFLRRSRRARRIECASGRASASRRPPCPPPPLLPPPPQGAPAESDDVFSFADALSLSRIAFAGALWFVEPAPLPTLALMGAAALSDVADGWLARRLRGGRPPPPGGGRGAWLDPLCDKVFVVSLVATLVLRLRLPLWLVALVSARELFLFVAFVLAHAPPARRGAALRITYTATLLGKVTTALQFAALALLVALGRVSPAAIAIAAGSALTGSAAVFGYIARALREAQVGRAGS